MYVVLIIDHIHHLLNELKKWKVSYIWDRREYILRHTQNIIFCHVTCLLGLIHFKCKEVRTVEFKHQPLYNIVFAANNWNAYVTLFYSFNYLKNNIKLILILYFSFIHESASDLCSWYREYEDLLMFYPSL